MQPLIANMSEIMLPKEVMSSFNVEKVEIILKNNNIIIKPYGETIKSARGIMKDINFSTEKYLEMKREEKELEL